MQLSQNENPGEAVKPTTTGYSVELQNERFQRHRSGGIWNIVWGGIGIFLNTGYLKSDDTRLWGGTGIATYTAFTFAPGIGLLTEYFRLKRELREKQLHPDEVFPMALWSGVGNILTGAEIIGAGLIVISIFNEAEDLSGVGLVGDIGAVYGGIVMATSLFYIIPGISMLVYRAKLKHKFSTIQYATSSILPIKGGAMGTITFRF